MIFYRTRQYGLQNETNINRMFQKIKLWSVSQNRTIYILLTLNYKMSRFQPFFNCCQQNQISNKRQALSIGKVNPEIIKVPLKHYMERNTGNPRKLSIKKQINLLKRVIEKPQADLTPKMNSNNFTLKNTSNLLVDEPTNRKRPCVSFYYPQQNQNHTNVKVGTNNQQSITNYYTINPQHQLNPQFIGFTPQMLRNTQPVSTPSTFFNNSNSSFTRNSLLNSQKTYRTQINSRRFPQHMRKPSITSTMVPSAHRKSISYVSNNAQDLFLNFKSEPIQKNLEEIAEERVEDTERASNLFSKKVSIMISENKAKIPVSELQKIKNSCVSKHYQQNPQTPASNNSFKNESKIISMKQTIQKYQEDFGYSILSINSCLQQQNQNQNHSNIKQSVQQSIIMNDFLNPVQKY